MDTRSENGLTAMEEADAAVVWGGSVPIVDVDCDIEYWIIPIPLTNYAIPIPYPTDCEFDWGAPGPGLY